MAKFRICLYGFDAHDREADTLAKARYADFKAAREAGYFSGRFGFHEYLCRLSFAHEVKA